MRARCLETWRRYWWLLVRRTCCVVSLFLTPYIEQWSIFNVSHLHIHLVLADHLFDIINFLNVCFGLVKCVKNVPAYLAERLFKSMKVSCTICPSVSSGPLKSRSLQLHKRLPKQNPHIVWPFLATPYNRIGHRWCGKEC